MTTTARPPHVEGAMRAAAERAKARIEDLEFMAAHGEYFDHAARRCGVAPKSLERWLSSHGRWDLVQALRGVEVAA